MLMSQNLEHATAMQTLKVFTIAHTNIVRNMLKIYTNKWLHHIPEHQSSNIFN